jgi:hypothetical protein
MRQFTRTEQCVQVLTGFALMTLPLRQVSKRLHHCCGCLSHVFVNHPPGWPQSAPLPSLVLPRRRHAFLEVELLVPSATYMLHASVCDAEGGVVPQKRNNVSSQQWRSSTSRAVMPTECSAVEAIILSLT